MIIPMLLEGLLCMLLFSIGFFFLLTRFARLRRFREIAGDSLLLVIAHPDDECMFFGPLLSNCVKSAKTIYVLCLSSGNNYGHGKLRKTELRQSCAVLGVEKGNIFIVEHTLMKDDPGCVWRKDIVSGILKHYIQALGVDFVVSFDYYGVSGHGNHISVYNALRHLRANSQISASCGFYVLESVNLVRKYSGILDVPLSYLFSSRAYVSSFRDVAVTYKAMFAHKTQMLWFRYLYLCFSRYLLVNTFKLLKVENDRGKYKKEN